MKRIMVATDLVAEHQDLFAAALRFALTAQAELRVVNVHSAHRDADWRALPTVRTHLEAWGVLPENATVEQFASLGLKVVPVEEELHGDMASDLIVRAHDDQPDLLMLGTAGRVGIGRLVQPSVAEPVSRRWGGPSLVVPEEGKKLVDAQGRLHLTRVVVPIDTSVDQQPVIDTLVRILDHLDAGSIAFTLVHVGDRETLPTFELPPRSDWMWRSEIVETGSVVDGILGVAASEGADLIAMGTQGHDSFLDAIRGSHTERVLRRAPCPVLVVPVH